MDNIRRILANAPNRLAMIVHAIFTAQSREVMASLSSSGNIPDLTPWVEVMADACKPLLLMLRQRGMVESAARIAARTGRQSRVVMPDAPTPSHDFMDGVRRIPYGNEAAFGAVKTLTNDWLKLKGRRRLVLKARKTRDIEFDFDLFNPKVIDAADAATYRFCRETIETSTHQTEEALAKLHELMREGLPRGDAIEFLARKVREIFRSPQRAFAIAATETSRAVHGGQMMAAQEAGVERHTWLASSDACPKCAALDGVTVKIGEPFYVDPKGGPYAVCLHPPRHVFCFCSLVEDL